MDQPFTNLDREPELWYACAGPLVQIPPANSLVYYFIQGHIEHCCSREDSFTLRCLFARSLQPRILCSVVSVELLADPLTEQVFAKFRLRALKDEPPIDPDESLYPNPTLPPDQIKRYPEAAVVECLERIIQLPPLTAYYTIKYDLHSVPKPFECIRLKGFVEKVHVGRSWGELLNRKRVAEGDTILLMNDRAGFERYGILRRKRRTYEGFGLDRGTVTSAAVAMTFDMPFDVYYYPRVSTPEFVVKAARVEAAMRTRWQVGTRFSMQYEDKHTSVAQTCRGTISSIEDVDHVNWPNSPWRMLRVIMNPPFLNRNVMRVNPWLLRLEAPVESSRYDFELPPKKRKHFAKIGLEK